MAGRMNELYEIVDGQPMDAVIRVIGVGGGGCNSVNEMVAAKIDGIDSRVKDLEAAEPEQKRTSGWVTAAVWAAAGLAIILLLKRIGVNL